MSSRTFSAFAAEVLSLYQASRAAKTHGRMRQVLGLFAALPGVRTTADLTPGNVAELKRRLDAAGGHPNSVATKLSYLRGAASFAVAMGYVRRNPFGAWPGLVCFVPGTPPGVHPPEAIAKVLAHLERKAGTFAGGRLWAWAAVLAHTGLRRDEALFLPVADVDLDGRLIRVRKRLKRRTALRTVPICGELHRVLSVWLPSVPGPHCFPGVRSGKPWSGGAPGYRPTDRLQAAAAEVGVEGFSPASLRHSFATHCATTWEVPPAVLQSIMGHTTINTTMRYYVHVGHRVLTDAAGKIRYPMAG